MKNKLQNTREKKYVSQSELSSIAGISIKTLQGYEQNQKDIKKAAFETVYKLSCALNCDISDIINENDMVTMQKEIHSNRCKIILKKALKLNQFDEIPRVSLGDIIPLKRVWDSKGEMPEESYSYLISHDGYDGGNCPIWINYCFKYICRENDPNKCTVQITDIELL